MPSLWALAACSGPAASCSLWSWPREGRAAVTQSWPGPFGSGDPQGTPLPQVLVPWLRKGQDTAKHGAICLFPLGVFAVGGGGRSGEAGCRPPSFLWPPSGMSVVVLVLLPWCHPWKLPGSPWEPGLSLPALPLGSRFTQESVASAREAATFRDAASADELFSGSQSNFIKAGVIASVRSHGQAGSAAAPGLMAGAEDCGEQGPSPLAWACNGIPCVPLAGAQVSLRGPFNGNGC